MACGYLNKSAGDNFAVIPETRIADFSLLFMKYQGIYFMKKTLIALAVAASATVSGSSIAANGEWNSGDLSGNVDFGGIITPADANPWEAKIGTSVENMNVSLVGKTEDIKVPINKMISVLSIRTKLNTAFHGGAGLTPQIKYGDDNAFVDFSKAVSGVATLKMNVLDSNSNEKLGVLSVPMQTIAGASWFKESTQKGSAKSLAASNVGMAFFGGVPTATENAIKGSLMVSTASAIDSSAVTNFDLQNQTPYVQAGEDAFTNPDVTYSGFYVSGIISGAEGNITLDKELSSAVSWKASLPIIVSYM